MRCHTARRWITADLAGELSPGRARRLTQHVERCEGCRRERTAYAALDRLLDVIPPDAPLSPRFEQDTLRRVRLAADDVPERAGRWLSVGVPALAGAAVLLLAVRAVVPPAEPGSTPTRGKPATASATSRSAAPAPPAEPTTARRRGTGNVPSEPPPELAAHPDLFVNLPVLRNMEKLQHYEAIQTTTLDEQHDAQSSG
jgi:hypothetical protein